jgi:predicted dehydrogenase
VFGRIDEMARQIDGLQGCDVTTDSGSHHRVALACFEAGLHVLIEKPLALTMRGCNAILRAARQRGRVLSVAENYRRDPINRLARALIQDGAIGTPQLMLELNLNGGNAIAITPWRHQKLSGTIAIDDGVHHADILLYYLGDAATVYGEGQILQPVRYKAPGAGGPGGFYAKWSDSIPDQVDATGEDTALAYLRFRSGARALWVNSRAAMGHTQAQRIVYGSRGALSSPGDRKGLPLSVEIGGRMVEAAAQPDMVPSYRLPPLEAQLFGGERVWRYDGTFNEIDARLLAQEYDEFARCIQTGSAPEVTGEVGRRAVALVNGVFESGLAGRPVTLDEIEAGTLDAYQQEIDKHWGLI